MSETKMPNRSLQDAVTLHVLEALARWNVPVTGRATVTSYRFLTNLG